jgi:hypothetical protein
MVGMGQVFTTADFGRGADILHTDIKYLATANRLKLAIWGVESAKTG